MKKDVIIKINSSQEYDNEENDEISFVTQGRFYKKKNNYYIKYDESSLYEGEGTKTTLKIENDMVTLMRTGAFSTHMFFKENEHHVGLYQTVAGPYTLGVKTKNVKNAIHDDGGTLELLYEVELNHMSTGMNTFKLEIKNEVQG